MKRFVAALAAALLAAQPVMAYTSTCQTQTALTGTGTISSSTLTIAASPVPTGTWGPGQCFAGGATITNTCVIANGTGSGGAGTYTINNPQTLASTALTGVQPVTLATANLYAAASGVNDAGNTCVSASYPCSLQGAAEVAARYNLATLTPVINLAAGTYAAGVAMSGSQTGGIAINGAGLVYITGPSATPPTAIIADTSAAPAAIKAVDNMRIALQFLKITSANGALVFPSRGAWIGSGDNMIYGKAAKGQLHAETGGEIEINCGYTIDGTAGGTTAPSHWQAVLGGQIILDEAAGNTITTTGTPVFGTAFAEAHQNSIEYLLNTDWTFAGTGASAGTQKFLADTGGGIETKGAAVGYFPGGVAGTASTNTPPGWYH